MLCTHLNRVIKRDDLDMIYIIGPGHGGPSLVAHAYLERTYSESYPEISQDEEGTRRHFRPRHSTDCYILPFRTRMKAATRPTR
jgi:xylulose-5-phosphate/fructose-6-phosphate phosphoketolase